MNNNNSSIQVFDYQDSPIRYIIDDNGEPWLVAKDVCDYLEISNARDAISSLDDDEKMTVANPDSHSGQRGGAQFLNFINEPGLYKLTFRSKKPNAKEFTRRVTHEILPSINKYGYYSLPEKHARVIKSHDKKPLPQTSAPIKAADKIYTKAFKAKTDKDFQAILALDQAFIDTFGRFALEIAGLRIERTLVEVSTTFEERLRMPKERTEWSKWVNAYVLVRDGQIISSSVDNEGHY